jgi:hypothetical protein
MDNRKILITVSPEAQAQIETLRRTLGRNKAALIRAALATADPEAMAHWFETADDLKRGRPRIAA